jgi:hypothetical protein
VTVLWWRISTLSLLTISNTLSASPPDPAGASLLCPGNYPYGASLADRANKLSYDLYYLRNLSFWLDLLIMVKTMRLVFNARGAVA